MGLSRNKVAVSEGAAGSPPFYGERKTSRETLSCKFKRFKERRRTVLVSKVVQFSVIKGLLKQVGVTNAEGPPVPIPNTEVKLCSGENTWLEAARENSSMPTQDRERIKPFPDPEKRGENYNHLLWGCSSAGRAPALQAGGHGFESHHLHQSSSV